MVLIGISAFLVPSMLKTWCRILLDVMNEVYPTGMSFCTRVLRNLLVLLPWPAKAARYTHMMVFNPRPWRES